MARSKKKFSGLVIAVVVGCLAFVGFQYLMVDANENELIEEDIQDVEAGTSGLAADENEERSLMVLPEIQAYVEFIDNHSATEESMGADSFVHQAVLRLAGALETISNQEVASINKIDVDNLREQLSEYHTAQSTEKSKYLKTVITSTAGMLHGMQGHNIPLEEELQELRSAADAVNDQEAAVEQSADLDRFFDQVAVVLGEIERNI